MAGGLGKRLAPLTDTLPKPLLPIGEKSILEIIVRRLKLAGCDEVIIATNYKSNLFEKYASHLTDIGVKLTFSREDVPLGTAGPLKLVRKHLDGPFIIINGDIITTLDFKALYDNHVKKGARLTVCTKEVEIPLHYGVIELNENADILSVREKPSLKSEINAGIYVLNPEVIDEMPDGFYHMTDLIKDMLKKEKINGHRVNDYWLDVGQLSTYNQAKEEIEKFDTV